MTLYSWSPSASHRRAGLGAAPGPPSCNLSHLPLREVEVIAGSAISHSRRPPALQRQRWVTKVEELPRLGALCTVHRGPRTDADAEGRSVRSAALSSGRSCSQLRNCETKVRNDGRTGFGETREELGPSELACTVGIGPPNKAQNRKHPTSCGCCLLRLHLLSATHAVAGPRSQPRNLASAISPLHPPCA